MRMGVVMCLHLFGAHNDGTLKLLLMFNFPSFVFLKWCLTSLSLLSAKELYPFDCHIQAKLLPTSQLRESSTCVPYGYMWRSRDRGRETDGDRATEGETDGCPLISSLLMRPESHNTARDRETVRTQRSTSLWFGLFLISKSTAGSERSNKQMHAHIQNTTFAWLAPTRITISTYTHKQNLTDIQPHTTEKKNVWAQSET